MHCPKSEEWLHYRRTDQEQDIREDQKRMEQAKKRLASLDVVMSRLYEDYAFGEISKEKYKKMTADYEAEVPSRFMRKFVCRLRLSEVSRQ